MYIYIRSICRQDSSCFSLFELISTAQIKRRSYDLICNHENNVPSRLSPQWFCGNSCTWENDAHIFMIAYILLPSCFCKISELCLSWISYG